MEETVKSKSGARSDGKIKIGALLLACALCFAFGYGVSAFSMAAKFGGTENFEAAQKYLEVKTAIDNNYIGTYDDATISDASASGMVKALGDQWSYYMTAAEYETYKIYSSTQSAGIGVVIKEVEGDFTVSEVTYGGLAYTAGISVGDIIVSVNGEAVSGMTLSEVTTLIRSCLNISFAMSLERGSESVSVTVDCATSYKSTVTYELMSYNVGYVKISDFEAGSGSDAVAAVEDLMLSGARSIIFDVRDNAGGLLSELLIILDYLLPSGDVFTTVDKDGNTTTMTSDNVCVEMPMAVLINSNTYEVAEYFAAALDEFNWATLVGEVTMGKGRIQTVVELSDGSALMISNETYLTPNGVDLAVQGGLIPDLVVKNADDNDEQLTAAISIIA